jgi:hypothetical protein
MLEVDSIFNDEVIDSAKLDCCDFNIGNLLSMQQSSAARVDAPRTRSTTEVLFDSDEEE